MRRMLTLIALACLLTFAPLALAAPAPPTESYSTLLHQIDSGQVTVAHVNELTHDVRVTLKDGTKQLVAFPAAQHKVLIDSLIQHGVKPIYTKHKKVAKPVHHVLRYVAAGVVVVLLLIGGGVWMYTRGQRPTVEDPPSGDAPAAAGP